MSTAITVGVSTAAFAFCCVSLPVGIALGENNLLFSTATAIMQKNI